MRFFKAFLISLLIYLLLIWLLVTQFSKIEVPTKKTNNHVIKIDLKNIPDPIQKAVPKTVQSEVQKTVDVAKPLPKKLVKKKEPAKKKVVKKKAEPQKTKPKKVVKKKLLQPKPKPKVVQKKRPQKSEEIIYIPEPFIKKPVQSKVDNSEDLASFLGSSTPSRSTQSYPNSKIQKLYGATFHTYTPTQKKFIEDNLDVIQRITQATLTRRGYPEGAGRTGQEGTNVVSFNLHPNGNISDLRLKRRIGYRALDDNTIELIKTAYKDYPYPSTTTRIVFYVTYSIYGY